MKLSIISNDLNNTLQAFGCLALRSNALLSAFSVLLAGVFINLDFGNY
jgi:hypothetical protein